MPEITGDDTGGTPIVGYDLQIDDGNSGDWSYVIGGDRSQNTLQRSIVLSPESHGIESGLNYRIRFRAINAVGEGEWSDISVVRAVRLPQGPPSPVVSSFDNTQIVLSLGLTPDDGNSQNLVYKLYSNEGQDGSAFHELTAYDGSALTFTINVGDAIGASGLSFAAPKSYHFKYTAVNEVGESSSVYPTPVTKVALARVPDTPTQPVIDMVASNQNLHVLTWDAPGTTDGLAVDRYLIYSNLGISGQSHLLYNSSDLAIRTFVHDGLELGNLYSYWMRVQNFNGLSADLTTTTGQHVMRYACGRPEVFSSLIVTARSSTGVTLGWAEPASVGCPITSYTVKGDDGTGSALADLSGGAQVLSSSTFELVISSPAIHTLVVGTEYRFAVIATNPVGTVQSNVVDVIVANLPIAPTNGPQLVIDETQTDTIRVSLESLDHSLSSETGGTLITSYHL